MANDPVCNMQIDEKKAGYDLVFKERVYYFCSQGCKAEFQRHPEDYALESPEENRGTKDV